VLSFKKVHALINFFILLATQHYWAWWTEHFEFGIGIVRASTKQVLITNFFVKKSDLWTGTNVTL
jgi:hypothetical protein